MIRALFILLSITNMTSHDVYAHTEFSREELIEEALIVRYLPNILEVTGKLFMCERISDIKRIDGNREHELTIDVITFEKAHMPPYDLYRITFIDIPNGITTKKVTRAESISPEELKKHCVR